MSSRAGRASRAARAIDDAVAEFFTALGGQGAWLRARGRGPAAGRRRPGDDHAGVRRARGRGRRGRGRAHPALPARGLRALAPRVFTIALTAAITSTRRGATTTRRRASASSSCSARPSAGRRRRIRSCGPVDVLVRRSPARLVRARGAGHVRPGDRGGSSYLYALPAGDVPLAFHFSGSVLYAGRTAASRSYRCRGRARRRGGCRSRPGAR